MKGIKQLSNQNFNMSAVNSNISSINFNSNMASMMNINNSIIFDRKINSKAKSDSSESSTCDKPIYKWVSDSAVTSCYSCACTFSLFIRRHHCRVCGRIFCHNCCNNWKKIPANISIPQKNYTMRDALTGYIYSKTDMNILSIHIIWQLCCHITASINAHLSSVSKIKSNNFAVMNTLTRFSETVFNSFYCFPCLPSTDFSAETVVFSITILVFLKFRMSTMPVWNRYKTVPTYPRLYMESG